MNITNSKLPKTTVLQRVTEMDPRLVGLRFVAELMDCLNYNEWKAMVAANEVEPNLGVCHSHDYCDANMVMESTFELLGLPTPSSVGEGGGALNDAGIDLWNKAWDSVRPELGRRRAALTYVTRAETYNSGGNCMIDFIHLHNGRVLGISDDCVVLYQSMEDFQTYSTQDRPAINL